MAPGTLSAQDPETLAEARASVEDALAEPRDLGEVRLVSARVNADDRDSLLQLGDLALKLSQLGENELRVFAGRRSPIWDHGDRDHRYDDGAKDELLGSHCPHAPFTWM